MTERFGGNFTSTNLDLLLAVLVAVGVPLAAAGLLTWTGGAAASLVLYYGVGCVLIPRWRKGTLDYHPPQVWPWRIFALCLLVPLGIATVNWVGLPRGDAPLAGFLVTLIGWSALNGAMEQLSWFYVLDAWRNRWSRGALRWIGLAVGVILLLALVALIHIFFWVRILPTAEGSSLSWLSMPLHYLLIGSYALLYYRSRSMWPVFFVHLLTDVQLVLLARYSILPYL